jgi:hypothetical protein
MDENRCRNRNAKYCESCSQLIRKQQSAEWKRNKRARVGWRAYKEEYYPYADELEEREYRRGLPEKMASQETRIRILIGGLQCSGNRSRRGKSEDCSRR